MQLLPNHETRGTVIIRTITLGAQRHQIYLYVLVLRVLRDQQTSGLAIEGLFAETLSTITARIVIAVHLARAQRQPLASELDVIILT